MKSAELSVVISSFREFPVQILSPVLGTNNFKVHIRAIPGFTVLVHSFLDIAVLLLPSPTLFKTIFLGKALLGGKAMPVLVTILI